MMKVEIRPCERCGIQAEVDPKTEEHLCDRCRKLDGLSIEERVNLDATKNRGYMAREFGRYGSHPSHDRFDGDSDP